MAAVMSQPPMTDKNVKPISEAQSKNKDLFKTRLCTYFLQGACTLGSDCKFAHQASEMRAAPNLAKTQLCSKFMNGHCFNTNCSYAHGEAELVKPPNFKKKLCSWHRSGQCRNGAACGFAHCVSELVPESQATWFAEKQPWNKSPGFPGPGTGKAKREDDGADASTVTPSSSQSLSLAESDMSGSAGMPQEHLFRMMAGRGSAPLQQQVESMTAAIGDLQAKLTQIEGSAMPSQVVEMKQAIQQLVAQCADVQARLNAQQAVETTPQQPATKVPQPTQHHAKVASSARNRKPPLTQIGGEAFPKIRAPKPSGKAVAPWWDHTGVRATLGVLLLAMMVAVEVALK